MNPRHSRHPALGAAVTGLALLALNATPVSAQALLSRSSGSSAPCTSAPPPAPCPAAPAPGAVQPPGVVQPPEVAAPSTELALDQRSAGLGGETVALANPGGYLDNAIPMTMFRLRYDAGFDMNRPDRAEFFYGAWQELSFHPHGVNGGGVFFDPKAKGPEQLPGRLDYQEASAYFELARDNRVSVSLDVPVRFVDFDQIQEDPDHGLKSNRNLQPNPGSPFFPEPRPENEAGIHNNLAGLSDLVAGLKYAVVADPDQYLTFQFRVFIPTGDADRGLGTGHVSLEPDALFYRRLNDKLEFQAQFGIWVPVAGTAAEGNILIYGAGLGYTVYQRHNLRVEPIVEVVGWTVLNGFESVFQPIVVTTPTPGLALPNNHGVLDASGDTIINAKAGVRTYFGRGNDLYIGFGQALTTQRWYDEIVRVEYRLVF